MNDTDKYRAALDNLHQGFASGEDYKECMIRCPDVQLVPQDPVAGKPTLRPIGPGQADTAAYPSNPDSPTPTTPSALDLARRTDPSLKAGV